MEDTWNALRAVLCQGHQRLVDGLNQMVDAIQNDDYLAAAKLAGELDHQAGAHVEFEERYLYPLVERQEGEAYAARLYEEHVESIETLIELQRLDPAVRPGPNSKHRWLAGLKQAIDHLTQTFALVDYLQSISPARQTQLLDRYAALQKRAHLWSQLHPRRHDSFSPITNRDAPGPRKLD